MTVCDDNDPQPKHHQETISVCNKNNSLEKERRVLGHPNHIQSFGCNSERPRPTDREKDTRVHVQSIQGSELTTRGRGSLG